MPHDRYWDTIIAELRLVSTALENHILWLQGREQPELLERALKLYEQALALLNSLELSGADG